MNYVSSPIWEVPMETTLFVTSPLSNAIFAKAEKDPFNSMTQLIYEALINAVSNTGFKMPEDTDMQYDYGVMEEGTPDTKDYSLRIPLVLDGKLAYLLDQLNCFGPNFDQFLLKILECEFLEGEDLEDIIDFADPVLGELPVAWFEDEAD